MKNDVSARLIACGAVDLDRIVRYLSTWKGTDNFLEILSHVLKIVIPILHLGARLRYRAGIRKTNVSGAGERLAKLAPLIGDSRMLFRFWGILPIIQWLQSHFKFPPATSRLSKLERWQIFTMLAYFPTEQLYYLRVHDVLPAAITLPFIGKTVPLHTKGLLQLSSRLYLAYIVLEFFRLKERTGLLYAKQKALSKANTNNAEANAEKAELKDCWKAHKLATVYNTFRLPGALHWSLESGIPLNDAIGAVLDLAAALITFRGLWDAAEVNLPPPPPATTSVEERPQEGEKDARASVQEAECYPNEPNGGVAGSASTDVEIEGAQA